MLESFFNIEGATKNKELFKGLKIENSPYFKEQGKYPVIYLDMKALGSTYEELKNTINDLINILFIKFGKVLESDILSITEKQKYQNIADKKEINPFTDMSFLCYILSKVYGQKVIVLIDEYDNPLTEAYKYNYYDKALPLLRNFYSTLLKSNKYLNFAVVVGIVRLSQTNIFSGLNNLEEYNILRSSSFDEFFGFTEDEVKNLLSQYDLASNLDAVREYYDGYLFGKSHMYNPLSITQYLQKKIIDTYWCKTATNTFLKDLLKIADQNIFNDITKLLKGQTISRRISDSSTLAGRLVANDIFAILLFAGYITIDAKNSSPSSVYTLKLPNKEVLVDFADIIANHLFDPTNIDNLQIAITEHNIDLLQKSLRRIFAKNVSYFDLSKNEREYHLITLVTLLPLENIYNVKTNVEGGDGRPDILMIPKYYEFRGYIFEFKYTEDKEELCEKAQEGLLQIEDKKYYLAFKEHNIKNITIIGIAFSGKSLELCSKDMFLNENDEYVYAREES